MWQCLLENLGEDSVSSEGEGRSGAGHHGRVWQSL